MIRLTVVDAFTHQPFHGNPAAVCLLPQGPEPAWPDPDWMQAVAREMNLSETAYLLPQATDRWSLRWFTPTVEVELCGHATLASAHALWESGVTAPILQFDTQSGPLRAQRLEEGWIRLDFPATPPQPACEPDGLSQALGARPSWIGKSHFDYLVLLETAAQVHDLRPDHTRLAQLPVRGVMVTAPGPGEFDFVSRFFAPGSGISEDPVTGSAHCCLTPFWAERLDKPRMRAYQDSARGGTLRIEHRADRVWLEGQAVSVAHVQLC